MADTETSPGSSPAGDREPPGTRPASAPGPAAKYAKLGAIVAGAVALVLVGKQAGGYVTQFAAWVDGLGVWGPLAFIAGYAIATVGFIPGSFLTLAGGALFGFPGALYVLLGASVGASSAFLISRYLARDAIESKLQGNRRFRAIDRAIAAEGRKIVFLLRLSPVFPFNLLNYALGLTRVRFVDYAIACLGMAPGTFLYVYYGKAAGDLAALAAGAETAKGAEQWVFLAVGLIATFLVTWIVTGIARKALRQATAEEPAAATDQPTPPESVTAATTAPRAPAAD